MGVPKEISYDKYYLEFPFLLFVESNAIELLNLRHESFILSSILYVVISTCPFCSIFFSCNFSDKIQFLWKKREMINRRLSLFSKHARVKLAQIVNILFNLFEKTRTRRSKSVPLVFLNWLFLCQREITGNICQWVKKRTKYFEDLYYLTSRAYIPIPA